jgi:hypothetical protein
MRSSAPAKDRRGDHHSLLGMGQVEIAGDLHAQRAEHHPDHEGHVEVEKRGDEGWPVAGLPERVIHGRSPSEGGGGGKYQLSDFKKNRAAFDADRVTAGTTLVGGDGLAGIETQLPAMQGAGHLIAVHHAL